MPGKKKYGTRRKYPPKYSKKYGSKKYSKSYYRRKFRSPYSSISTFGANGLPRAIYTKLNYVHHQTLQSVSGAATSYAFRLNSLFDPDYSGVGTQPYMRDQWSALYRNYQVFAVKVSLLCSTGQTNGADMLVTLGSGDTYLTISDINTQIEQGAMRTIVTNDTPKRMKRFYKLSKLFGVSPKEYSNQQTVFGAASGSNPSKEYYIIIGGIGADYVTTTSVEFNITISYYCKWWDRIDQGAS